VARRALLGGMDAHQREASYGVIEDGAIPIDGGVAAGAVLREVSRLMGRIGCAIVVRLVTTPTGAGSQAVIVIDVALCALQAGVRPG